MAVLDALPGQAQASRFVKTRAISYSSMVTGWTQPRARRSPRSTWQPRRHSRMSSAAMPRTSIEPSKLRGAPSTTAPTGGACLRPTVADSFTVLVT